MGKESRHNTITRLGRAVGVELSRNNAIIDSMIDNIEIERIERIKDNWLYYRGIQRYDHIAKGYPYANIVYTVIEKLIAWSVRVRPVLTAREDIYPVISELQNEIIENSGGDKFFYESQQMGRVTGDCFIQIYYDSEVNDGLGGIALKVLDSQRTFVEYKNVSNNRKLSRILYLWDEINPEGNVITYSEIWDADFVRISPVPSEGILHIEKIPGMAGTGKIIETEEGEEFLEYINPYGELPFIHIRNMIDGLNIYGVSDVEKLKSLNREVNEQLIEYKLNLDYNGKPILAVKGASMDAIERNSSRIWSNFPVESEIQEIKPTDVSDQIKNYLKVLEWFMGMVSFPIHLTGYESPVRSEISHAALKLTFMPLIEAVYRSRINYSKGYAEAIECALRAVNRIYDLGLDILNSPDPRFLDKISSFEGIIPEDKINRLKSLRNVPFYRTTVSFYDPLPKNTTNLLVDLQTAMANGLESLRGALMQLGVQDIDRKIAELYETAEILGEIDMIRSQGGTLQSADLSGTIPEESPSDVEDRTGQSADRTVVQRQVNTTGITA